MHGMPLSTKMGAPIFAPGNLFSFSSLGNAGTWPQSQLVGGFNAFDRQEGVTGKGKSSFSKVHLVGDDILVFKRVNPNLVCLKNLTQMLV